MYRDIVSKKCRSIKAVSSIGHNWKGSLHTEISIKLVWTDPFEIINKKKEVDITILKNFADDSPTCTQEIRISWQVVLIS